MAKKTIIKEETGPIGNSQDALAWRMGSLETTVSEGLLALHTKLDVLRDGFVSHEQLAEAEKKATLIHSDQDRRIRKLEDWNTWLVRLVVGALILSALALVIGTRFVDRIGK